MVKKEIKFLQKQIEKLDAKDFDFEAWKKYSMLQLTRIFGEKDPKISQLNKIDFEFNSWSLRDASGNESYEEGSKRLAREVLQAAIDELDIYGLPEKESDINDFITDIIGIVTDEFKGSQIKKLKVILFSNESEEEKKRRIKELLEELENNSSITILTNVLLNPQIIRSL